MKAPENVYEGDLESLTTVDINAPLGSADGPTCYHFVDSYRAARRAAESSGRKPDALIFQFLEKLMAIAESFDTPASPFRPFWRASDARSTIPEDLTSHDLAAVRILAGASTVPAVTARLNDLLWHRQNDVPCGLAAAEAYVRAARLTHSTASPDLSVSAYARGLYLARQFGPKKQLYSDASAAIEEAVASAAALPDGFYALRLMELMVSAGIGDKEKYARLAADIANDAKSKGQFHRARCYWELEASWRHKAKDRAAQQAALILAAEAQIAEAEKRMAGASPSYLAGASLLSKGIEALRQAEGDETRVLQLRARLNEIQISSMSEFETIATGKVDISESASGAREHVAGKDLPMALLCLAFGVELSSPEDVRKSVLKIAESTPFLHLMGTGIVDHKGRRIARKEALFGLDGIEKEKALEAECFAHEAQFHWPLRAEAFIEPARGQILIDHRPSLRDLHFVVENNPFVPPGHEGLFLRGLHAGIHGDFQIAAHLLTPQIENSIRHVLEAHGVDVSNLKSDGTQPVKMLGSVFDLPRIGEIFEEQILFELRGCLIEKTGFDFRNRIAHGFVSEPECFGPPAITIWWLVLRLCLFPFYLKLHAATPAKAREDSASAAPMTSENPSPVPDSADGSQQE
ncbi:MAG: DUF4209 domain-containing protein [Verrucomicrobia bacterium]|nr:DUF4209 domain-containing protein [Verrucomicrobiota bacterium]